MSRMLLCGPTLYKECCERYSVKPNRDILQQVNRADLMYLTKLDASKTFLGSLGVRALLDFVEAHRGIEEINLQKNGVDQLCIEKLCQILREGHPGLHSITLSNNLLPEGSARLLWDTIRSTPMVYSLKVDDCNVSKPWIQRLTYVLEVNASHVEDSAHGHQKLHVKTSPVESTSFGNAEMEDDQISWKTVSFLVISSSESYIKLFHDGVLLPLGSYFSLRRLRVEAAVVTASDSSALVEAKIVMCRDFNNGGLPWCVTFFDPSHPFTPSQRHALRKVLETLPQTMQECSTAQQGHRKGNGPGKDIAKQQNSFFFYAVPSSLLLKRFGEQRFLDSRRLLGSLGFEGGEAEDLALLLPGMGVPILRNATHLTVRCQSDLYAAISRACAYRQQLAFRHDSSKDPISTKDTRIGTVISIGQEKVIKTILTYVAHSIGTDDVKDDFSVPMIIYGDERIGKENVFSYVASYLQKGVEERKRPEEREGSSAESTEVLPSKFAPRVVTYNVQTHADSLAGFLYFVLSVFNPSASLEYETVDVLCASVREAITGYREEQPIVLFVSHVDGIRGNPFTAVSARTGTGSPNPSCGCIEWIPSTFPPTVRIIISLHTDHPTRVALRQHCPQPKEFLCPSLSGRHLIDLLNHFLLDQFQIKLPGLHTLTTTLRDRFTTAELAYLEKPHHNKVQFPVMAAAYLACTIYERGEECFISDEDEVVSLLRNMPGTLDLVVQKLCECLSALHSAVTVRYISICLSMSPMPQSELLYICEELGDCPKHLTSVVLKEMTAFNLVHADSTSCLLSIAHDSIRDALLHLYEDHINYISVLVEQHLYRLVATLSPEIFWAFRSLVPLQLANGSFNSLGNLLQSSIIIDAVLSSSPTSQIAVINAFFQLQRAQQLLEEMKDIGYPVEDEIFKIDSTDLATGLQHVQRYRSHFLQEVILAKGNSRMIQDAQRNAAFASYPVGVLVNNGTEDTSQQELECDNVCLFCTCREDYVAAVTNDSVMVFSMKKKGNCVAHKIISPTNLEEGGGILGIFIAAQMKAIIVRKRAILFLDFSNGTTWTMEGYQANVSDNACLLNKSGRLLLLHRRDRTGEDAPALEVLNLSTKTVETRLERTILSSSKSTFCGDYIFVIVQKYVYVLDPEMKEIGALEHDDRVRCVCGAENRRIAVTSVNTWFWVWMFNGTFLNRVETGLHPILALTIDSNGSLLITRHAKGLRLWNTATGTFIANLSTSGKGNTSTPCFTMDNRKILAITGSILNVWDSTSGISIGAIASPTGSFTSFSEQNNLLYTTSVFSNMIKVWNINEDHPLSSEKEVLEGRLTTQLFRNPKLSKYSLVALSIDPDNAYLLALDSKGELFLFSLESGNKIATQLAKAVHSAFLLDSNTIVYTMAEGMNVMYYNISTQETTSYPLFNNIVSSSKLQLIFSTESNHVFAISTSNGTDALFVCEVSKNRSNFVNLHHHQGAVLNAFFFGSFMYSIGTEDKHIFLWNVEKRACRADYKHPLLIEYATCTPSGVLFFVDESGKVYQLVTENITSPSHARLVSSKLNNLCPKVDLYLNNVEIKRIYSWSNLFVCTTKANDAAIIVLGRGLLNSFRLCRGINSVKIIEKNHKQKILIGTSSGDCFVCELLFPHSEPFHLL